MQPAIAYESLPPVKEYRVTLGNLATGLNTGDDGTGDTTLLYNYAKVMDPASVVRESEMGMAESAAARFSTPE